MLIDLQVPYQPFMLAYMIPISNPPDIILLFRACTESPVMRLVRMCACCIIGPEDFDIVDGFSERRALQNPAVSAITINQIWGKRVALRPLVRKVERPTYSWPFQYTNESP